MRETFVPAEFSHFATDWHYSPVLDTGAFVFLSGITGVRADATFALEPETQFRDAFNIVAAHLAAARLNLNHVVEMTTYHVGLRAHLKEFLKVKDEFVTAPYPAWTAVGVFELLTPGTLLEIRVIAKRD